MNPFHADVAKRKMLKRGIHDLNAFVKVARANQDQAKLKATLRIGGQ